MKLKSLGMEAAAVAMATAPLAAQATVSARSAPVGESSEMGGEVAPIFIIGALAAAGMIALIVSDDDDDDDDVPVSN